MFRKGCRFRWLAAEREMMIAVDALLLCQKRRLWDPPPLSYICIWSLKLMRILMIAISSAALNQ